MAPTAHFERNLVCCILQGGADKLEPIACKKGTVCPEGSAAETVCTPGTYADSPKLDFVVDPNSTSGPCGSGELWSVLVRLLLPPPRLIACRGTQRFAHSRPSTYGWRHCPTPGPCPPRPAPQHSPSDRAVALPPLRSRQASRASHAPRASRSATRARRRASSATMASTARRAPWSRCRASPESTSDTSDDARNLSRAALLRGRRPKEKPPCTERAARVPVAVDQAFVRGFGVQVLEAADRRLRRLPARLLPAERRVARVHQVRQRQVLRQGRHEAGAVRQGALLTAAQRGVRRLRDGLLPAEPVDILIVQCSLFCSRHTPTARWADDGSLCLFEFEFALVLLSSTNSFSWSVVDLASLLW